MDSRREFLKKAALLSSLGGVAGLLPPSIQRAFAIDPPAGTTYLDAEHVVILMQENRSFDHCFGAMRGVRGFNDPRAIQLPDKKPVWLQTNERGETYSPFRLNIKDTKATWMGSLPHGWTDQVDARNGGRYDQWLVAKKSGNREYSAMPLTLGYYNREDLPFYYSMADAFTICDQNFCSSLTGTTPNRLHLWTGTVRENAQAQARIRNEETDYGVEAAWKTFPERLEENGISWKIYQNEISVGVGFDGEHDAWLANFTDNPIEWFTQYRVKMHPAYIDYLPKKIEWLKSEIKKAEDRLKKLQEGTAEQSEFKRRLSRASKELEVSNNDLKIYTKENFEKLSENEKNLHRKAFTTNRNDPNYHDLATVAYQDGSVERQMKVPKGDVLHQFREDVKNGVLPTVSWLVAPENFSDHPGAPWYGAWYLSESLDILTQNPEVWKKTIFILCYDENDGYFDHVPPFVPPVQGKPETGLTSASIHTAVEHVTMEQELKRKPAAQARESSIGLGYRVPLVIASPWSRGGRVCSQVFDHTSILMFLEKFLTHKTGKKIEETNISSWRRTVCGDLTATFTPYNGERIALPSFVKKTEFVESIHKAQFKSLPTTPTPLGANDIETMSKTASLGLQEKGSRPANAIPYELGGACTVEDKLVRVGLRAGNQLFGANAAGAPFMVYVYGKQWSCRSYAVAAGDELSDTWPLSDFENENYHLRVDGPNGFYREFKGNGQSSVTIQFDHEVDTKKRATGNLLVKILNHGSQAVTCQIKDLGYGRAAITRKANPNKEEVISLNLQGSGHWYDSVVLIDEMPAYETRFAGHVETGKESVSDPLLG